MLAVLGFDLSGAQHDSTASLGRCTPFVVKMVLEALIPGNR